MVIPGYISDPQGSYSSCFGPISTLMALQAWNKSLTITELLKIMKYNKGLWFFETYIASAAHKLGIPAKYVSSIALQKMSGNKTYFEKVSGLSYESTQDKEEVGVELFDEAAQYVLDNKLFEIKNINIQMIKDALLQGKLVIATINRNVLLKKTEYKAHFLLLKQFDGNNFIANDALFGQNFSLSEKDLDSCFYYIDRVDPKIKVRDMVIIG